MPVRDETETMGAYDLFEAGTVRTSPETAHGLTHRLLRAVQTTPVTEHLHSRFSVNDPRLRVEAFGNEFPNPVVAAGPTKNAEVPRGLAALGFGHVEVGGVTAEQQPGNPRPRLFRLREDEALINRMGFNNGGADIVGERLDREPLPEIPVGINIGKSKSTPPPRPPRTIYIPTSAWRTPATTSLLTSPARTRPVSANCRTARR